MCNLCNYRLFYNIPKDTNIVNFWISPGHYGKSIKSVLTSGRLLISEIPHDVWMSLENFESKDGNIEIGNTSWDKGVIRVHFQAKLRERSRFSIEEIKQLLANSEFTLIPQDLIWNGDSWEPDFNCF